MPVTLENRTRQMQVFSLEHSVSCREKCSCAETVMQTTAVNPRTGEIARKLVTRKLPGSISFLALERREGLPLTFLDLPAVKTALQRGQLRIVVQAPDLVSTPIAAPPSSTPKGTQPVPAPKEAK